MAVSYFRDRFLTLYHGDCRDMVEISDSSVHCVVTSPPYLSKRIYKIEPLIWGGTKDCKHAWGSEIIRRDRGSVHGANAQAGNTLAGISGVSTPQGQYCQLCGAWRGHLGLEPSPELYIQHLIEVFREVKRILRPDGLVFVNLGDTHAGSNNGSNDYRPDGASLSQSTEKYQGQKQSTPNGLHAGELIGIPWRFAFAMQADGWRLRQDIIWHKPAPMPESVNGVRWEKHRVKVGSNGRGVEKQKSATGQAQQDHNGKDFKQDTQWADCPGCPECALNDGLVLRRGSWRPTASHEYIFMFAKSDKYWADREAVREIGEGYGRSERFRGSSYINNAQFDKAERLSSDTGGGKSLHDGSGRNLRSVWRIGPEPFKGAHFAVFPTELPEICIKASTSEVGVCPKCGAQWATVIKPSEEYQETLDKNSSEHWYADKETKDRDFCNRQGNISADYETIGWRATCKCGETNIVPALVLDPFAGTFATGEAAVKLGRRAIGYELSEDYCKLARERNQQGGLC